MGSAPSRRAVTLLIDEAWAAMDADRYAQTVSVASRAVQAAEFVEDVELLARALSIEAEGHRMLGDHAAAFARYTRVLTLANDPAASDRLATSQAARAVARAYLNCVECGLFLTGAPWRDLLAILDAADRWLAATGHREWRSDVLLERAKVWEWLGDSERAVAFSEEALAAYRSDSSVRAYTSYLLRLGSTLRNAGRHRDARERYQEILDRPESNVYERKLGLEGLARCALDANDPVLARQQATAAVQLAEGLGDNGLCPALETLADACAAAGDIDAAGESAARHMASAGRIGGHYRPYYAVRQALDVALVRADAERARDLLEELVPHAAALDAVSGGTGHATACNRRRGRLAALEPASPDAAAPVPGEGAAVHVVDATGGGDHETLQEAVAAAAPGDRIVVRPGRYTGGVVLDKPLRIAAEGAPGAVVVESDSGPALAFRAATGVVTGLTLRATGATGFCVSISMGSPHLEDCDISSSALACVGIYDGANPTLRRNRIHDGADSGVYVYDNGLGLLEDNDIFGNTLGGVAIKTGANPTLRHNRIHHGKQSGVYVFENGRGLVEDNDVFANGYSGVEIKTGANPVVRRNRIHDAIQNGLYAYLNGRGLVEENDIFANAYSGVEIRSGANPTLRRNRIHDGRDSGVYALENGLGLLEDNDIFANALGGVAIRSGANPTLRRNRIHDGVQGGVYVYGSGRGLVEDNDIFANGYSGVEIKTGANPTVRRNRIHDGKQNGVYVYEDGLGLLEDNDVFANGYAGVSITGGANPTLRRNRIHDGQQGGVYVHDGGLGLLEENDIFANAYSGVAIKTGANPTLRRNRIHDGRDSGVYVYEKGRGVVEDNEIAGNGRDGLSVAGTDAVVVRRNRFQRNARAGIWIRDGGGGTFVGNEVLDSWDVATDCLANVRRVDSTG